jgi:hypothetical protein
MGNLPEERATHHKGRRKEELKCRLSRSNHTDSSEDGRQKKGRKTQEI